MPLTLKPETRKSAIDAAVWVTASPHEWEWTHEQQVAMARMCCWSSRVLSDLNKLCSQYACTIQESSIIDDPPFVVVDVDGDVICKAATLEDAAMLGVETIEAEPLGERT